MIERSLKALLLESLNEFRIVYLPGPRQAGKSTLVKRLSEQTGRTYLSLDDKVLRDIAKQDPKGFIDSYEGKNITIDEIQYVPDLVYAIKQVSDQLSPKQKGKFLLTGSVDLFSSKAVTDRLPGHMDTLELYPFSLSEIDKSYSNPLDRLINSNFKANEKSLFTKEYLCERILIGGYPEVQDRSKRIRSRWFRSYISARMLKDFDQLYDGRGDYLVHAEAMLSLLAGRSGNLMSYNNLAGEIGIGDEKSKNIIIALERMFIVKRFAGYLNNPSKRLAVTTPKLNFVDTGLACYLLGLKETEQLLRSPFFGGLLENLIVMDLYKNSIFSEEEVKIYHYRDNQKKEVDIVLEEPNGLITGIEIKASKSFSQSDFKGLISLAKYSKNKFKQGYLIYTGEHKLPVRIDDYQFWAIPFSMVYN